MPRGGGGGGAAAAAGGGGGGRRLHSKNHSVLLILLASLPTPRLVWTNMEFNCTQEPTDRPGRGRKIEIDALSHLYGLLLLLLKEICKVAIFFPPPLRCSQGYLLHYPPSRTEAQPPTVACKNGSSVGIRTGCTHVFCTFGVDLYAQSAISNKNFCVGAQSEVH